MRPQSHSPPESGATRVMPRRHVFAVALGNALEFYNFVAYAFFALQISRAFFPARSPSSSLLLALATFGAGFLMRPLGGVVLGRLADGRGRRPAMMLSFTLMGIGMLGLALTPPYRSIGLAAPIMVIAMRLLQGFAVGGEVGPSLAFLVEAAPPARRGFYASLQPATADAAAFIAGITGVVLATLLTPQRLDDWGWRVAFLMGAAIVPVGLLIRRTLPETLQTAPGPALRRAAPADDHRRVALLGFAMLACATVIGYVQTNLTTYAASTLHMSARAAFGATMVSGLCMMCFDPVGGWLSDQLGRKPVMITATALLAASIYPAFFVIVRFNTPAALYSACAVLAILTGLTQGPVLTSVTEALPHAVRAGTLAIVYALAISVFGGTTQFVVNWLIGVTGNALAPGWYMLCAAVIGVGAMCLMPESAPRATPPGKPRADCGTSTPAARSIN
jgi:MHS family citrate/tricarballylate:H+ symporter-like MFS transporter